MRLDSPPLRSRRPTRSGRRQPRNVAPSRNVSSSNVALRAVTTVPASLLDGATPGSGGCVQEADMTSVLAACRLRGGEAATAEDAHAQPEGVAAAVLEQIAMAALLDGYDGDDGQAVYR